MGDPEPAFGFPRVLEALLELRFPGQQFEVINAAMTAVNSHVVLPIVRDCRTLDADAWVVYLGNNEVVGPFGTGTVFGGRGIPLWLIRSNLALNRTRIGQLLSGLRPQAGSGVPTAWGGMTMFLDHQVRHDDPSLRRVYDQFARNLGDILDLALQRKTPVVISTVVSNLRNCAPFASLPGSTLAEDARMHWHELYQRGCTAQADGRYDEAITAYEQALRIDPDFAELQFRLAECLISTGDAIQARERFRQARDLDTLRFRADSTINETIVAVAQERAEQAVRLVDAAAEFARRSPDEIPGEEFLCEHVHFNFAGNYLLAKLVAEPLIDALDLPAAETPSDAWPSEQQCADRLGWTPYHQLLFARELRTRLRSPPFNQQLNHTVRDDALDAEITRLASSLTAETARVAVGRLSGIARTTPERLDLARAVRCAVGVHRQRRRGDRAVVPCRAANPSPLGGILPAGLAAESGEEMESR